MKKLYVTGICTLMLAALLFYSNQSFASVSQVQAQKTENSEFKSYREWKIQMVDAAEQRVLKVKLSMEQQRQVSGANIDPNLKNQLSKEQLQASIAGELSINDYFVGYLNKQMNLQSAIKNVSGKLSSEEVAELMSAYAYSFNKVTLQPLKSASDAASKVLGE